MVRSAVSQRCADVERRDRTASRHGQAVKRTVAALFLALTGMFPLFASPSATSPPSSSRAPENAPERNEGRTLDDALDNQLQRWDRLVRGGNGSRAALEGVQRYQSAGVKESIPDLQPLLRSRESAARDADRLGEALVLILLSRESLVLFHPTLSSSYGHRHNVWSLIPGRFQAQRPAKHSQPAAGPPPDENTLPGVDLDDPSRIKALNSAREYLETAIGVLPEAEGGVLSAFLHLALSEYWYRGREQDAVRHAEAALRFFEGHDYALEAARTHELMAEAYLSVGDSDQAFAHLILNLRQPAPTPGMSRSFRVQSEMLACDLITSAGGSPEQCLLQQLDKVRKSGGSDHLALTLRSLGAHYLAKESYDQALEKYTEAVSVYQQEERRLDAADVLSDMAALHWSLGEIDVALRLRREAAAIYEQDGEIPEAAHAWAQIGVLANQLGRHREGFGELLKALAVFTHDRFEEDVLDDILPILTTLGSALEQAGDIGSYRQALRVYELRLTFGGNQLMQAAMLLAMSRVESRLGSQTRALRHLDEAARRLDPMQEEMRKLAKTMAHEMIEVKGPGVSVAEYQDALTDLGVREVSLGRYADGIRHLEERLRLDEHQPEVVADGHRIEAYRPDTYTRVTSHYQLALALLGSHKWAEALPHALQAMQILEKFQVHAFLTGRARSAEHLGKSLEPVYHLAAALYLNLQQPEDAFSALERGRIRVLLAMAHRRELAFRTAAGRAQQRRYTELLSHVSRLRVQLDASGREEDRRELLEALYRQEQELSEFERTLTKKAGATGEFFGTPAVTVKQVQATVPADTAVIEYAILGDVVAFVIRKDSFVALTLQNGDQVNEAISGFRKAQVPQLGLMGEGYEEPARRLHQLLFAPLEPHLTSIKKLVIVADGALHLLPIEALKDQSERFLIESYTFSYLNTIRELIAPRQPRGRGLLAFGGATYSTDTTALKPYVVRPRRDSPVARGGKQECERPVRAWGDLPGSDEEARAVARLFAGLARTGLWATEVNFKREAAGRRYIVISSHGYFSDCSSPLRPHFLERARADEEPVMFDPLVHSGIVFAGANTGGDGYDDGYLTALEVLGLNLAGVEVAVLSACETGVGELEGQEGVMGLRRSFFVAGAQSLVISLWLVPNAEAKDLVVTFFKQLKRGDSKADALRKAKLKLIREGKVSPFYWAAFVLVGR